MITEEVKLNTKDKDYQNKRGTPVTEPNNKIWGEQERRDFIFNLNHNRNQINKGSKTKTNQT